MHAADYLKHYRPNIGIVLFDRQGRVFFGRRVQDFSDISEFAAEPDEWRWQFPQGGVDNGEDYGAAAHRELKEETGVASARLILITPGWLLYDFPAGYKKRNWRGQRQKWAAMLFEGEDSEVDLAADAHQEFDDWRWGELEEAPGLIVPFKRHVYEEVTRAFAPLRDFLRSRR
ncbi:MAG: RNA pyrophosphohydrolase [Alphaproteobacteria bacterium]|nr:RNA pyrophosphohydrolase [Alphaproteobacteria bacterium]